MLPEILVVMALAGPGPSRDGCGGDGPSRYTADEPKGTAICVGHSMACGTEWAGPTGTHVPKLARAGIKPSHPSLEGLELMRVVPARKLMQGYDPTTWEWSDGEWGHRARHER
jgi:hypothetical protein